MSKLVKDLMTQDLRNRYESIDNAVWVEIVGVDGITTNEFRHTLHNKQFHLEVVKNSLFRRAIADAPLSRLAKHLEGPCALVTGGESAIDAAKVLDEWLPKLKGLRIRGALLEGEYLDEATATGLSKMPTKRDIQGRVAGAALSPGANLAAAILSGGGLIAGCLKHIIEKHEQEGEAAAAA